MTEREQLEKAIQALEAQRPTLGDAAVDAAIAGLQARLSNLETQTRKQVTVIFADVSGYTTLSENLDAEEVTDLMNSLWSRLDRLVLQHGGRIDKHMGDAVMALWGAAETREDDAERAIRAALALQQETAAFTQPSLAKMERLALHIGIHTGPVLLGSAGSLGEFTAIGDAVNLAQRLQAAAAPGEILISEQTHRQVRGIFVTRALPLLTIKGRSTPVSAFRVTGIRSHHFHPGTRGIEGMQTRMVGRQTELKTLQDFFQSTLQTQMPQATMIVGDAGVGKSRLLYEFENWLTEQPAEQIILRGRAVPETTNQPYGLLRDVFRLSFAILENDASSLVLEKFRRGMDGVLPPERADLVGQLIGFDFSASPAVQNLLGSPSFKELATADLFRFFNTLAGRTALVLFLEDLHWADASSLDLLEQLMRAIPGGSLFVLGLTRPTLFERLPSWGRDWGKYARLDLKPLSPDDSRQLVNEILRRMPQIPDDLSALVLGAAEGNPYYVEELIKMFIDDGVIIPGDPHWRVELPRLAQVHVPPTLTGILQARLDSLPEQERLVLQRAAVVGRLFWDRTVETLHVDGDRQLDVITSLQSARRRELVFQRDNSAFAGAEEYIFKHILLRQVTYETVLIKLRRVYHLQVAQWLEANAGERLSEYFMLIASHYEQAEETQRAAEYLYRAGKELYKINAYAAARQAFQRAIGLAAANEVALHTCLQIALGRCYASLNNFPEAIQHLQNGSKQADALGLLAEQSQALDTLGSVAYQQGNLEQANIYAGQALEAALSGNLPNAQANALGHLGLYAQRSGDYLAAQNYLNASMEISQQIGDRLGVAFCLNALGTLAWSQKQLDQAEAYITQALEIRRALGSRRSVGYSLNDLGVIAWSRSDFVTARRYFEESLAIHEDNDDRWAIVRNLGNLAAAAELLGERQAMLEYSRRALKFARQLGDQEAEIHNLTNLAQSIMIENTPLARQYLVEALEITKKNPSTIQQCKVLFGIAKLILMTGEYHRAAKWVGLLKLDPVFSRENENEIATVLEDLRTHIPAAELEADLVSGQKLDLAAELESWEQ